MGRVTVARASGQSTIILLVVLFLAAWAPASANADLSWSTTPQTLTSTNSTAAEADVATDAAGDALAVWVDGSGGTTHIVAAQRSAGQNFVLPVTSLNCSTCGGTSPTVAMNARGDAVVAWSEEDGGIPAIYYRMRPAGGTFSTGAFLTHNSGDYDDTSPAAAIDAAGNVILAWREDDGSNRPHIITAYRPAGANTNFDPAHYQDVTQDVTQGGSAAGQNYLDVAPSLSMDPAGDAVVAWNQSYASSSTPHAGNCPDAAFRPKSGDPSDPLAPGFGAETTLFCGPESGGDQLPWSVTTAIDTQGNSLVAYAPAQIGADPAPQVHERYRTAASSAWSPDAVLGPGQFPAAALDSGGDASLLWRNGGQIESADQPAGGSFGAPAAIASSPDPVSEGPELGIDSQGRPAALWGRTHDNGDGTSTDSVQASSADASSGSWAAPTNLDSTADLNGYEPSLSVSSSAGQAVAMWSSVNANSDELVFAAFGTPPGSAPPPPPPPPPPPAPNPITVAAPIQAGKAIVLTANVSGDVSKLDWQIDTQGGIDGAKVAGVLQNSIRFHSFQRQLSVKLTVTGPGGSHTYSRGFILPALRTDRTSKTVDQAASSTPRVFGVGDAQTLLGHTTCGPVTVYSGRQQVSGCLRPVNALADIPSQERGVIQTVARSLGLDPSDSQLMDAAMGAVDGYVGVGPTTLNNTWPAVPKPGADMMSFPGLGALTSSGASLDVGGVKFGGLSGGFSLPIDPSKFDIPLGSLPKPQLPDIGGFPLIGDWNIDLGTGDATIDTHLSLPDWLSFGGVPTHIPISFKATPHGLVLNSLDIGPIKANLGPLTVSNLELKYDRPSDTWAGSAKVCLLTGVCLDMSPPAGEVKIVHGALNYAGATLDFQPPGVPLFAGVNLTKIGFGVGLDPTRLKASAGITVLDLVELDGELIAAFPTADHPFVLARDEVGPDFPADLYGKPFHEPTIGAAADVLVNLPVVGYVKLASGYVLYEVPDFIALGGNEDFTIPHVLELGGSVSGAANFSDNTLNFNAEEHACLLLVGKICANAVVDVSKAPNDGGGAGGCVGVGPFHIGGGVLWKGFKIVVWPFDGCKWSRFKVDVRPSIAAASVRTMVVQRGHPSPAMEIYGRGAAPLVRVTGPGGQALDSTNSGFDHSPGGKIRILRYQGNTEDFTVVGLEHAQPGTYMITAMPGSVPFGTVASATDPPAAKISAHITGAGERRVLRYDIRNRPNQTVTFWDTGTGGAARPIGHVNGGGRGKLRFTAPPGDRRRTLYAQFALEGIPAERIPVATYKPPAPTLRTPRGLHAIRHKTRITVSFKPVAGATRYEITLTDPLTGFQRLFRSHGHRDVLTKIPATVGGVLAVRAVDPKYSRASLTASTQIKRLAKPSSRFSKLGHCTLRKRKLTCTGGPPPKHKPVKHKPPKKKKRKKVQKHKH